MLFHAGVSDEGLQVKQSVVQQALDTNRQLIQQGPLQALQAVGGLEMAAMTGAFLEAARRGIPAVVDGYISGGTYTLVWALCVLGLMASALSCRCRMLRIAVHVAVLAMAGKLCMRITATVPDCSIHRSESHSDLWLLLGVGFCCACHQHVPLLLSPKHITPALTHVAVCPFSFVVFCRRSSPCCHQAHP